MDENIVKFQEKLRELVSLGKKKKGILEIQEINDFFSDMELDSDQMEKVFDYLEANNVDVLRISNDDDDIPRERKRCLQHLPDFRKCRNQIKYYIQLEKCV